MVKQIKESEKKENAPFQNLKNKFEIQLFSQNLQVVFADVVIEELSDFSYSFFTPSSPIHSIFHPPEA